MIPVSVFPIVLQIAELAVDYVQKTFVNEKKLNDEWNKEKDGEKAKGKAVDIIKEELKQYLKEKEMPDDDRLKEEIEAVVNKKKPYVVRRATPEEINACIITAIKYTKSTYVDSTYNNNPQGWGEAEEEKTFNICKEIARKILKSHYLRLEEEILKIYIYANIDKLKPAQQTFQNLSTVLA